MINSSGRIATLRAFGEPMATGGPVLLRAEQTAMSSFGMLISGDQLTSQPVVNGNGWRCVGGPRIGRFASQVGATGAIGTWDTLVDPSMIPTPSGAISLLPGTTWAFQGWFRDGPSVNFTNTVSVTFQ